MGDESTQAAWDHIMAHTELLGPGSRMGFFAAMNKARASSEELEPEEIIGELASLVVDLFMAANDRNIAATKRAINDEYEMMTGAQAV